MKTIIFSLILLLSLSGFSQAQSLEDLKNIEKFAEEITSEFGDILEGDVFRIGIAQKILNLYLKYLWVAGEIKTPPHFPVDRIMINHCGFNNINWTAIDNIEEYKKIINRARQIAGDKPLAVWELEVWNEK